MMLNLRKYISSSASERKDPLPQIESSAIGEVPAYVNVPADIPPFTPVQMVLHQLAQTLTILNGTADLILQEKATGPAQQALQVWLQPNARQAEMSMHMLRELRLGHSTAATELSQCLTVLVLAADMLSHGQLTGSHALETYALIRRNANRAMKSLCDLREELLPGARRSNV